MKGEKATGWDVPDPGLRHVSHPRDTFVSRRFRQLQTNRDFIGRCEALWD